MRLNKYLAFHAGISRREADVAIEKGKVQINGVTAIIGARVEPGDSVTIEGKLVKSDTEFIYLMLNKPVGYVCSRRAQGESPTVYELLPAKYEALKTVGRLDKDSSGLILLTNDGDYTLAMTHPRFGKVKKYLVQLDKQLEPLHQQMISDHGINLEDGPSKFTISRLDSEYEITMHEGRNRQIRRTFAALGYTVTKLHRTDFGAYTLGNLPSGKFEIIEKM